MGRKVAKFPCKTWLPPILLFFIFFYFFKFFYLPLLLEKRKGRDDFLFLNWRRDLPIGGMPDMASLMLLILTPVGGEEGMGVGRNVNGVGGSHDRRNWRDLQLRRWNLKRRSNLKRRFQSPLEERDDGREEISHSFFSLWIMVS